MGCDVHVHAEILVAGKWEHYNKIKMKRCYAVFEKMAGVRGDHKNAIAHGRGLPHDASVTTKLESEHEGGHSHNWLSSKEVYDLINFIHEDEIIKANECVEDSCGWGYFFGHRWVYFRARDDYPWQNPISTQVIDFRFVFWFDS